MNSENLEMKVLTYEMLFTYLWKIDGVFGVKYFELTITSYEIGLLAKVRSSRYSNHWSLKKFRWCFYYWSVIVSRHNVGVNRMNYSSGICFFGICQYYIFSCPGRLLKELFFEFFGANVEKLVSVFCSFWKPCDACAQPSSVIIILS